MSDSKRTGLTIAAVAAVVLIVGALLAGCISMAFVLWLMMGRPDFDLSALAE